MADTKVTPPKPAPIQYRLRGPLKRQGKQFKAGALIVPTPQELVAFPDRFELVPTIEQMQAEFDAQIDAKRKAVEDEAQSFRA